VLLDEGGDGLDIRQEAGEVLDREIED